MVSNRCPDDRGRCRGRAGSVHAAGAVSGQRRGAGTGARAGGRGPAAAARARPAGLALRWRRLAPDAPGAAPGARLRAGPGWRTTAPTNCARCPRCPCGAVRWRSCRTRWSTCWARQRPWPWPPGGSKAAAMPAGAGRWMPSSSRGGAAERRAGLAAGGQGGAGGGGTGEDDHRPRPAVLRDGAVAACPARELVGGRPAGAGRRRRRGRRCAPGAGRRADAAGGAA
jgi:hypothetical protein